MATRRQFLASSLGAGLALPAAGLFPRSVEGASRDLEEPLGLARRFPDLPHHFVFEYYPWYGGPPDYDHWDYLGRHPPFDIASPYMPRLGPYDVRSRDVLEQHARWITEAGVGAIALSWWGRGSWQDQRVSLIMDVMRDHGIKVTFAMEPYADNRASRYADDILYLLREYGEKRHWDALLILRNAHGAVWRQQTDSLRQALRADFDHVTLLADSLEFHRTPASGFDGIGIYDNYIGPERYPGYAEGASRARLLFSFNVNPGYLQIEPRQISDPC